MRPEEYVTMRSVEDWHWWYRSLRGLLKQQWNEYVAGTHPRFVDVGCGTGANLGSLAGFGTGIGLDVSRAAVGLCRERGLPNTAVGSANALPCPDGVFDAALSMDVLCHKGVADRQQALCEMCRILRPGGLLFLNLPAYQWLHSSHDVSVEQDWRPTAALVRAMLAAASFEPLRVTYWNTFLFPALAAVRLLRKPSRHRVSAKSDLHESTRGALNAILAAILTAERKVFRKIDLPFGLSVFAVARKPDVV